MKCTILFFLLLPFFTNAQIITTVAGNGSIGFSGDGGLAILAKLNQPNGIAVDGLGNIYIADQQNSRIRKVSTTGIITTFAGNGLTDYLGDGGLAIHAQMRQPFSVAVDTSFNVFIGDDNSVIRKVNTSGIISTYAGIALTITDLPYNDEGGPATDLEMTYPLGLATDKSGNVYFIAGGDLQVRKIDRFGIVSTIAGNGIMMDTGDGGPADSAAVWSPIQVAVDQIGNVFIVDNIARVVRKVDTMGIIRRYAGNDTVTYSVDEGDNGLATAAYLWDPEGVAVDDTGNVYISESGSGRIRKVDTFGVITTIAGSTNGYSGDYGPAISAQLHQPTRLAIDNVGNIYITDFANELIRKINIHMSPITGSANFCSGSTITLNNVTPGGTWSSGSVSIAVVGSGSGIVSGLSSGTAAISYSVTNLYGTATAVKIITVNPLPNAGTITGLDTICIDHSLILTDTNSGGTWSAENGNATVSSSGNVHGTTIGSDNIIYSISNSCGSDTTVKAVQIVNCATTEVHASNIFDDIDLFPNPAQNTITIRSPIFITNVIIRNLLGQVVSSSELCGRVNQVAVSLIGLPNGLYIANLNGVENRRFMKQ